METTSEEGCGQARKVQRRATKMIERLEGLGYLERLKILNLTRPETRFLRRIGSRYTKFLKAWISWVQGGSLMWWMAQHGGSGQCTV